MQVWSGAHDAKVCAINTSCKVAYLVGTLKDTGEVAQAGGTKAIVRKGFNVWVFGIKSVSIYSAHCITTAVTKQVRPCKGCLPCSAAAILLVLSTSSTVCMCCSVMAATGFHVARTVPLPSVNFMPVRIH